MKKLICAAALVSMGVMGCANKNGIPSSNSVTDISPAPSAAPAYTPAPQPVAQPVVYDTMTTQTPTGTASGSYTVKKGDTLYSIARSRYGDGKQWTKIASANPGVRPETLKVGQTIVVP